MKKQLYRVKQLADQRVGRAEKTDLLTEDLQHVEKSLEKIKIACSSTGRKLASCMLSSGPDAERRKKKLNQFQFGQSMLECGQMLGDMSILGSVLMSAGETQSVISAELATYETEIDETVLAPLQKLIEVDIPNIQLTKKKLSKTRLDMDACRTRWLNAVKVSQTSGGNKVDAVAKAELLKGDLEDQTALFQQIQDNLATEMFTFVAGERTYAQWFMKLMKAQMRYHEASLEVIKKHLPIAQVQLDSSMFRPMFGCPLLDHLCSTGRQIAHVIEECVLYLLESSMDVEGLFRLAGSSTKIKKLKAAFDAGVVEMEDFTNEVHAVTGVLKLYLRELPDPLLTFELFEEWIVASKIKDRDQKLQTYWSLVEKLPGVNKENLKYLICFLSKLAENSEENKMSAGNIAIVIAPNLLWSADDGGVSITNTGNVSNIVESLIEHCEWFFPGGCKFVRHQLSEDKLDAISSRFITKDTESPGSPEMPIMGVGSLFSEVSKKLGWKEGSSEVSNVNSASVQGYYNPLAAQYDPDLDTTEDLPSLSKKPTTTPQIDTTPENSKSQTPSTPSMGEEVPSVSSHQRTNSRDIPRRPAPPVPKHPPRSTPHNIPPGSPIRKGTDFSKPKLSALAEAHKVNKSGDQLGHQASLR
ncbi:rho GTPase-activating protein 44-like isoform X2 [Hydractinia symbiolongicarpus]|nr:rho GTPase-activating protein 44-like isoform X2 [Hydractinia symbiolongicarpus]XP_057311103.1 rho GTPase-activating protein 44-like isoform X2 [Hydractinia symbiolongicarpus]